MDHRRLQTQLSVAAAAGLLAVGAAPVPARAAPVLAPGVEPAADLTLSSTQYVVANDTPVYRAARYDPTQMTGQSLTRGERPRILGEANMGLYLLVGRDGKGIGYVPRSLLCPVDLCPDLKK